MASISTGVAMSAAAVASAALRNQRSAAAGRGGASARNVPLAPKPNMAMLIAM